MNRKNMDRLLMLALPNDGGAGGDGGAGSGDGAGTGGGAGAGAGAGSGSGAGAGGGGSGSGDQSGDGKGGPGTDQFKSDESKAAVLSDLASVRDLNKQLQEKVDAFENDKLTADEKRDKATQTIAKERDTAVSEAAKEKQRADRYEAAEKAGLELKFAKRISGTTLEEMVADATELAKEFGSKKGSAEHTAGAGVTGDGGAALTSPGMGTLDSYYANSKK